MTVSDLSSPRIVFDAGFMVVQVAKAIDAFTTDAEIDREADMLEARLARRGIVDRRWVRELLFHVRGLALDAVAFERFAACVGTAHAAGALGSTGIHALHNLGEWRRRSRVARR